MGRRPAGHERRGEAGPPLPLAVGGDRKSTRLNSSHLGISYAVFCLKKTIQSCARSCCTLVSEYHDSIRDARLHHLIRTLMGVLFSSRQSYTPRVAATSLQLISSHSA